ncbi:unnamed protein product [Brassica oleracea var. botrytis]
MDSSLPRIALTMVSGKKKILLLKKDRDNPVLLDFKTESEDRCWWERLIKGILQRSETA